MNKKLIKNTELKVCQPEEHISEEAGELLMTI